MAGLLDNSPYGSNITNYGDHDVVVGVTQSSVGKITHNNTATPSSEVIRQIYVFDMASFSTVLTDYEKFVEKIGTDPFTLPDGLTEERGVVKLLDEMKFSHGLQVYPKIPDREVDTVPDLITLKSSGVSTYSLVCVDFKVILLNRMGSSSVVFRNLQHDIAEPWVHEIVVDLKREVFSGVSMEYQNASKRVMVLSKNREGIRFLWNPSICQQTATGRLSRVTPLFPAFQALGTTMLI